ncbi:MAG: DUF2955 domain-containing protein [Lentimicrobium sp.]
MSGKSGVTTIATVVDDKLQEILRYAVGSALILMIAAGSDYTLAYLTPVLALGFLAPGAKTPTIKGSLMFLVSVAAASFAGLLFSRLFLNLPLVFLPLLALIIFHIYYTTSLQGMKLWLIISLLLIPMVSLDSPKLGGIIAVNLVMNAVLAILMVWLVYFIFPGKKSLENEHKKAVTETPSPQQRFISALNKTLVVLPVLILFFVFNYAESLLVMIFVAVLSMNPATSNKKAGIGIIIANLGGGLAAIAVYNLLTIATSYFYFGLLALLVGLIFGKKLFSGKPASVLFGMAFSTFLLILGNVTTLAGEAGEMAWARVLQIGLAVLYMVVAFGLVDRVTGTKKQVTLTQ